MPDDIYFTVENNKLYRHVENDGWTYMRRGPERVSKEVRYEDYKDSPAAQYAIKDWEERTGRKFLKGEDIL